MVAVQQVGYLMLLLTLCIVIARAPLSHASFMMASVANDVVNVPAICQRASKFMQQIYGSAATWHNCAAKCSLGQRPDEECIVRDCHSLTADGIPSTVVHKLALHL